jgi:hypothetical protein
MKATSQGKAIVQNVNGDWMVMFPDGTMKAFALRAAAEHAAANWFRRDAKRRKLGVGVGVTEIDPNE